jgi:hypothetical protein
VRDKILNVGRPDRLPPLPTQDSASSPLRTTSQIPLGAVSRPSRSVVKAGWRRAKGGIVDDRRDEVVDERDWVAETRDRTVDAREADLDEWDRQVDTRAEELGVPAEGTGAFAQRAESCAGRSHGRQDGEEARAERAIDGCRSG